MKANLLYRFQMLRYLSRYGGLFSNGIIGTIFYVYGCLIAQIAVFYSVDSITFALLKDPLMLGGMIYDHWASWFQKGASFNVEFIMQCVIILLAPMLVARTIFLSGRLLIIAVKKTIAWPFRKAGSAIHHRKKKKVKTKKSSPNITEEEITEEEKNAKKVIPEKEELAAPTSQEKQNDHISDSILEMLNNRKH